MRACVCEREKERETTYLCLVCQFNREHIYFYHYQTINNFFLLDLPTISS